MALIFGTICWPLLWLSGHPLEEWAATVVVLYTSLWLCKEVIVNLLLFASRRLSDYGNRIVIDAGIELPDRQIDSFRVRQKIVLASTVFAMFVSVVGASLSAAIPFMAWLELTPLASYFTWIGWMLFGIGATGLLLFFTLLTIAAPDNLSDSPNENSMQEMSGFRAIAEKVANYAGVVSVH